MGAKRIAGFLLTYKVILPKSYKVILVAGATERLMKPNFNSTRIRNYVYNTLITRSGTSMHQMKSGGRGFWA